MAKPSPLAILCGSCSWKNIHGGHGWHSILKYNYFTVCAKILHTSMLRIYKPGERGVFIKPCYVQCGPCSGRYPQLTNLMRGDQAQYSAFLPVSVIFDIPRKIFKRLSKNLQKPDKLYYVTVFNAVIWVS